MGDGVGHEYHRRGEAGGISIDSLNAERLSIALDRLAFSVRELCYLEQLLYSTGAKWSNVAKLSNATVAQFT
jgi:hypothetical protein